MKRLFTKGPHLSTRTKEFIKTLGMQKPLYKLTPTEARYFLLELQRKTHKNIEANIEDTTIHSVIAGNISIRIARPANYNNEILPAIIYIHGGGWIMGNMEVSDMLIRKMANETNSAVFFVDYTKSPEAKYPTALKEILESLNHIHNNPKIYKINQNKIAIVGDSAGGNMAIATLLKNKIENGPKIIFQLLFYPVTSTDMNTESYNEFQNGPWLTKKAMEWFWNAYEPSKKMRDSIYISPLKAKKEELQGLPQTLIITAENDVLKDEGEEFARKLDEAGVPTLSIRINNTFHDFAILNALSETEEAKGALNIAFSELRRVFKD